MKYALAVEVKLVQVPDDPEPVEPPRPGDDPVNAIGGLMTRVLNAPMARPMVFMGQPAGFDFRKEITVSVHGFAGLAGIIERFDSLVSDIETEKLEAHS